MHKFFVKWTEFWLLKVAKIVIFRQFDEKFLLSAKARILFLTDFMGTISCISWKQRNYWINYYSYRVDLTKKIEWE